MCLWKTYAPGCNKVKILQMSLSPTFWPRPPRHKDINIQVWLLYHHPNFEILHFVWKQNRIANRQTHGQTDNRLDGRVDGPITSPYLFILEPFVNNWIDYHVSKNETQASFKTFFLKNRPHRSSAHQSLVPESYAIPTGLHGNCLLTVKWTSNKRLIYVETSHIVISGSCMVFGRVVELKTIIIHQHLLIFSGYQHNSVHDKEHCTFRPNVNLSRSVSKGNFKTVLNSSPVWIKKNDEQVVLIL